MDPITYSALLAGTATACLVGQAYIPLLRSAPPTPAPEPPAEPERSPDWCHSHGKPRSEEED